MDGVSALHQLAAKPFDLVVLDLMLPKMDGWEVCRQLRANHNNVPIIMLTARAEVHERIEGLRMGADDYLVKPFDPNELLARMDSIFRRLDRMTAASNINHNHEYQIGNLSLYAESYTATMNSEPVALTRREFELLIFLIQHPGKVYTRDDLITQIWGWDFDGEERVVDLYVQRIRRKLGQPSGWNLTTVWGVGYKFEVVLPC